MIVFNFIIKWNGRTLFLPTKRIIALRYNICFVLLKILVRLCFGKLSFLYKFRPGKVGKLECEIMVALAIIPITTYNLTSN